MILLSIALVAFFKNMLGGSALEGFEGVVTL